jgi:hypothetical protein
MRVLGVLHQELGVQAFLTMSQTAIGRPFKGHSQWLCTNCKRVLPSGSWIVEQAFHSLELMSETGERSRATFQPILILPSWLDTVVQYRNCITLPSDWLCERAGGYIGNKMLVPYWVHPKKKLPVLCSWSSICRWLSSWRCWPPDPSPPCCPQPLDSSPPGLWFNTHTRWTRKNTLPGFKVW